MICLPCSIFVLKKTETHFATFWKPVRTSVKFFWWFYVSRDVFVKLVWSENNDIFPISQHFELQNLRARGRDVTQKESL